MRSKRMQLNSARPSGHIWLAIIALSIASTALAGCLDRRDQGGTERWVTTEDTNVAIDWDKVAEAYKKAEGPADFEKRVNEIYEGKELVSIAVADQDEATQVVTGFFDHNTDGKIDEGEKIFTITRRITGEDGGEYQVAGHGHYAGYHSPMMGFATGMLLGSMMTGALSPGYRSMAYTTSPSRLGQLQTQRNTYRAQNPGKYSKSGRTYNSKGTRTRSGSGVRRSGGGRFGIRGRRKKGARPERLSS